MTVAEVGVTQRVPPLPLDRRKPALTAKARREVFNF